MQRNVLIRPLITEKLTRLMEEGQYTFEVDLKANKVEIKKALEARYPGARILSVRTMIARGKRRRQQTRRGLTEGRTAFVKKAIVSVDPAGEPIDFFGQV